MGQPSLEHGPTDVPLLDETIGANLARTVAAHGEREALVSRHQGIRWTYDEFGERVRSAARKGLLDAGLEQRRPGRPVEPELRRVDAAAVRHGRDRRHPRQPQPGVPHPRAGSTRSTSRAAGGWSPHPSSRRPTTSTWSPRSAAGVPGAGTGGLLLGPTSGTSSPPAPATVDRRRARATAAGLAAAGRPDQHPVHVGHDRVPEGRHAHPPQHPQQRVLRDRAAGLHARATGCASRCPSTTASGW